MLLQFLHIYTIFHYVGDKTQVFSFCYFSLSLWSTGHYGAQYKNISNLFIKLALSNSLKESKLVFSKMLNFTIPIYNTYLWYYHW